MSRTFTFCFARTGKDLATANDRFALPGRTVHLRGGRLQIEFTSDAATGEAAKVDAERYREALQAAGLFLPSMHVDGEPDSMGWAHAETVNSASPRDRALISRALRLAREAVLELPADDALRQAYRYLHEAQQGVQEVSRTGDEPPSSIFVALYKAIETVEAQLGGRKQAGADLGVARELKAVGLICNDPPRDTRHALPAGGEPSQVSFGELCTALEDVRVVVQAYEKHLGLP